MRFIYHPELLEQVVFLAARNDSARECEVHLRMDNLYSLADPELRARAFRNAYAERFTAWGLGRSLEELLLQWSFASAIDQCVVVCAARRRAQKVDLLSKSIEGRTERTLLMELRPDTVLELAPQRTWLRRELLFVADMLDESFGYKPDEFSGSTWERKLCQDRYMVLWRVYVAGRLARAGEADAQENAAVESAFARAFARRGVAPSKEVLRRVLHADSLTHSQLAAWAMAPQTLLGSESCNDSAVRPGGLCPLCGFPTYDWFEFEGDEGKLAESIQTARPTWVRAQGACRQCAETYGSQVIAGDGLRQVGGDDVRFNHMHPETVIA